MSDTPAEATVEEATPTPTSEDKPETVTTEPALDPEVETTGVLSATDPEHYLSDEEKAVQERQEAQAAELAPGETLPWVAPTPTAAQPPEIVAPDPQDAIE